MYEPEPDNFVSDKVPETAEFFKSWGSSDSRFPARYARLLCPDGNSTLSIDYAENIPENHAVTLYFECEDLDKK